LVVYACTCDLWMEKDTNFIELGIGCWWATFVVLMSMIVMNLVEYGGMTKSNIDNFVLNQIVWQCFKVWKLMLTPKLYKNICPSLMACTTWHTTQNLQSKPWVP
jgi:hypothetical protein